MIGSYRAAFKFPQRFQVILHPLMQGLRPGDDVMRQCEQRIAPPVEQLVFPHLLQRMHLFAGDVRPLAAHQLPPQIMVMRIFAGARRRQVAPPRRACRSPAGRSACCRKTDRALPANPPCSTTPHRRTHAVPRATLPRSSGHTQRRSVCLRANTLSKICAAVRPDSSSPFAMVRHKLSFVR